MGKKLPRHLEGVQRMLNGIYDSHVDEITRAAVKKEQIDNRAAKTKKRLIRGVEVDSVDLDYVSVDRLIEKLSQIRQFADEKCFENLRVEPQEEKSYDGDYIVYIVRGDRHETDTELRRRVREEIVDEKAEAEKAIKAAEEEQALYLKLREKYERKEEKND